MPSTLLVLIADNDPDDRDFFQAALEKVAFPTSLHQVQDGEELMEFLCKKGRYAESSVPVPDILFLDLNMPKIDGLTALQRIRSDKQFATLPVYILTTSYNLADFKRCNLAGCHGFFTKPHLQSRLVQQLNGALSALKKES